MLAESRDRIAKERAMRRRQLKWLVGAAAETEHDEHRRAKQLLMKLGRRARRKRRRRGG